MSVTEEMLDKFYPGKTTFTKKEVIGMLDSLFSGFVQGAADSINKHKNKDK